MKNKKGFVLTETLVVTVFLVTIFTFIYVSVVPLLGKYEDAVNHKSNIDVVYQLYNIRKMIKNDGNRGTITADNFREITCNDLRSSDYCYKLMEYLEVSSYKLYFTKSINNNLSRFPEKVKEYLEEYKEVKGSVLVFYDTKANTIVHLLFS